MKKLLLVIDANVLVSALLKDSTTRKLLLKEKTLVLFSPEFVKEEISKYVPDFSKKLNVKTVELEETIKDLFEAAKITVVSSKEYGGFLEKAIKASPDKKDAAYLALALKLGCPVWSQDKQLKKQGMVKVFSTKELLERIEKENKNV